MKLAGLTGLLTAFVSSLCCTVPLITLLVGATGSAGGWAWLEPLRPYCIALTVGALGWAWYEQLKPQKTMECNCETKKTAFWQTKSFLGVVTGMALLLLAFPSYSNFLYQDKNQATVQPTQAGTGQVAYVTIKGMSCEGCEQHIKQEVTKVKGVSAVDVSYQKGAATVKYDSKKTSLADIKKAVDATGYKVTSTKTI
ncbi:MAG: mercuric transport protein MerTP [Spirosoma sp.]|jgi:copper chaperone CopZ|uniref:mercuric transport protein MerTP n=1 Tax=Spirosoma sp. TaxID=1899569 RepID=UPI001AD436EB|nr:mercuric transport protein MerTP [Spirosoma sp.]MBN8820857.1 mercuric transport protein MerTP [Spirosoma sp.]